MKIRIRFYIVSKGAVYKTNPLQVAKPVLTPAGGTFAGPTYVWVTTATPGAEIHRAYDAFEPSFYSILVDGPVKVPISRTLNVKGYLTGYDSSPLANGNYTITGTDNTGPMAVSAQSLNDTTIQIVYSEYVSATAKVIDNYTIDKGIEVKAVELLAKDMKTINLTTTALASGNYTVTVNNIRDLSNNLITGTTQRSFSHTSGIRFWAAGNIGIIPVEGITGNKHPIRLYYQAGKLCKKGYNRSGMTCPDLPSGVYFLQTNSGREQDLQKIIMVH
jgi:hypothetical protein